MLKLQMAWGFGQLMAPAAFGRLCVETTFRKQTETVKLAPAAFGRLCVETVLFAGAGCTGVGQPPSGGCVLKPPKNKTDDGGDDASRLRAAVC